MVHFLHWRLVYPLFLRALAVPAFFNALPKYLNDEVVRVPEKRAMSTIFPRLPYQEAIKLVNVVPIVDFVYVVILLTPL